MLNGTYGNHTCSPYPHLTSADSSLPHQMTSLIDPCALKQVQHARVSHRVDLFVKAENPYAYGYSSDGFFAIDRPVPVRGGRETLAYLLCRICVIWSAAVKTAGWLVGHADTLAPLG